MDPLSDAVALIESHSGTANLIIASPASWSSVSNLETAADSNREPVGAARRRRATPVVEHSGGGGRDGARRHLAGGGPARHPLAFLDRVEEEAEDIDARLRNHERPKAFQYDFTGQAEVVSTKGGRWSAPSFALPDAEYRAMHQAIMSGQSYTVSTKD